MFCTDPHPQVLAKHGNEVRGLQEHLRKARIRRNSLSRRLRGTEEELLRTKDVLHRLQLLSEDRSLKEREELSHRLALISVDLNRKNKRIQVQYMHSQGRADSMFTGQLDVCIETDWVFKSVLVFYWETKIGGQGQYSYARLILYT